MNPMRMRPRTPVAAAGVDRRVFLKATAAAGAGLTLGIWSGTAAAQASGPGKTVGGAAAGGFEPNAFLTIGIDNTVTVYVKHLEMGQGTYTGLPTLVAEELDCAWSQIRATGAPADASRYANLFWGTAQGTGGSTAIANSFEQYRQAGAAARAMLVAAAAKQWNVPPESVQVKSGVVFHANGKKATFGELASAAAREPVPANVKLKDAKDFVFIGKHVPRTDSKAKSNGTAQFTQDVKLPEMLTAVVAHPPRFGGQFKTYDPSDVSKVPGVRYVIEVPNGIAVVATTFWQAKKGRDALKIEWDDTAGSKLSSSDITTEYRRLGGNAGQGRAQRRRRGEGRRRRGEEARGLLRVPVSSRTRRWSRSNCVIRLGAESCEVWNGEQFQTGDQHAIAQVTGLKPEQVKLNMLYAGGSFGRRANPAADYLVEAAAIAKAIADQGASRRRPVKLVWTREDDMTAGYYRPAYLHTLKAGLDASGNIVGWQHRIVGQSILAGTPFEKMMVKDGIDATSVEGASTLPYEIPNLAVDLHSPIVGVPGAVVALGRLDAHGVLDRNVHRRARAGRRQGSGRVPQGDARQAPTAPRRARARRSERPAGARRSRRARRARSAAAASRSTSRSTRSSRRSPK